jgi:hypothetical protein
MKWTVQQFSSSANDVMHLYKAHNNWWKWMEDSSLDIFRAWKLYEQAFANPLGMLILGDAKIRGNSDLIMNFGVTNANGLSDEKELKMICDITSSRQKAAGAKVAIKVLGSGSVLNDQSWTPLLNDAFILGGVHGGHDFYWAEEDFARYETIGEGDFRKRQATFGASVGISKDAKYYKKRWNDYLLSRTNFWAGGFVRIFARELIGLKTFGYEAVFTKQGIGFEPVKSGRQGKFSDYVDALRRVDFHLTKNEDYGTRINAALGEFLFGDPNSLSKLGKNAPSPWKPSELKQVAKPKGWPT